MYAGADGAFEMVEDDGESLAYAADPAGATRTTTWRWDDADRTLEWSVWRAAPRRRAAPRSTRG